MSEQSPDFDVTNIDSDPDPFANAKTVPGLDHLGRAIVDESGVPSGSPANYEALRGRTGNEPDAATVAEIVNSIAAEFPPETISDDEE